MSQTNQIVRWKLEMLGIKTQPTGSCNLLGPCNEEELEDRVSRLGLSARFESAFPKTDPIYYGWFIDSPLNRVQTELLSKIIRNLVQAMPKHDYGHSEFQAVLELSLIADLAVHVEYTSPGHVDLGWHTVHCHCPRCKAMAPLPRWKSPYPAEPIDCPVCGHSYSPAATHSRKRWFPFNNVVCAECHHSASIDSFSE